jgi:hypothetical protein
MDPVLRYSLALLGGGVLLMSLGRWFRRATLSP